MQNKILCLFTSLIFLFLSAQGQNNNKATYDSIIELPISNAEKIEKIENFLANYNKENSLELSNHYYTYSKWHWLKNANKKEAIVLAKKALTLINTNEEEHQDLQKRILFNLGFFHRKLDYPNYGEAIQYYDRAIALSNETDVSLGKIYKEKGDIYSSLGNFEKALKNYESAERIQRKTDDYVKLFITYINVSKTLADAQDSTYIPLFNANKAKLKQLEKYIEISASQKIALLINEGVIYNTTTDYKQALEPTLKALKLAKAANETAYVFNILNNLGVLYRENNEYEKAEKFLEESKAYTQSNILNQSAVFNNSAELLLQRGDYKNAMIGFSQSMAILLDTNNSSVTYLPSLKEIKVAPYKTDILEYLIDKSLGWMAYYMDSNERSHLIEAQKTIQLADQIIDILYFESREELSKLYWRKKASNLYLTGVKVCHLLSEPEQALYYMEKNKGVFLLENINTIKAKELSKIPEPIIERELLFLEQIKQLESSIISVEKNTLKKDSLKNTLFAETANYEKFIDSLEIEFPKYHNYKKKLSIVSMQQIKDNLSANEIVIEYLLSDNDGYVLLIANDKTALHQIEDVSNLNTQIRLFNILLARPFKAKKDIELYQNTATNLFLQLFPFDENIKLIANKKVQIVPDGKLHTIPFEALTISATENIESSYLLINTDIHYQYSLTLAAQPEHDNKHETQRFVGFIPVAYKDTSLPSLTNSYEEINEMLPYFENEVFTYEKASKNQFLKSYNESSILHISTHGGLENKTPWLAFNDEKLQLDELYFINSPKELVVLSACKSSVGELKKGEGLYSITRGFQNAGAKSVVSTLWDVNEKSSAQIVSQFYDGIVDGKQKSTALKTAKLSYIRANTNTSLASPYYWSSIVLTGDNTVIETDSQIWVYGLVIGVLLLILLYYIIYKSRKKTP